MRIAFEQFGGVAGMQINTLVDTDALSAEEATELRRLISDAGLEQSVEAAPEPAIHPDELTYELTIETDGGSRFNLQLPDTQVPPAARPLIVWLQRQARQRRRSS